jgi:hypothetical protein
MWVNKQDLDAIAAEQRRLMDAILDDMKHMGERLDARLGTNLLWDNAGRRIVSEPVTQRPRRHRRGS